MAPERPRPDLDHTREALRQHDARVESDEEEAEDAKPKEGEENDEEDSGA
jgi:hypothetical protein